MREFQIFAKPTGALCNLDCRYCYYLKTAGLYSATPSLLDGGRGALGEPPCGVSRTADSVGLRMSAQVLERYISQHIAACPTPVIMFSWHGGEPTILGVDYFRTIVRLQNRYCPPGRRIVNGIQTNGLLIDEQWCRFFSAEGFRVGLSMDGPAELHDEYRVTRGHEPTHARVLAAFELLRRHRVPTDILCVVHNRNVRHPLRVYRFFKRLGATYIGFLPLIVRSPKSDVRSQCGPTSDIGHRTSDVSPESVDPLAYGDFLCAVFDEWRDRDESRISVQLFEEASRPARGMDHSLCIFRETCGDVPVVEHNGEFYCCDHFVDPAHRVGNINDSPLADLLDSPAQIAFGNAKRDALPLQCRECSVLRMCHGGCPKDRFAVAADGEEGLNYLCAGLKRFFTHVRPWAEQIAARERAARQAQLSALSPTVDAEADAPKASRNSPCPCGSGRKYKYCCGRH